MWKINHYWTRVNFVAIDAFKPRSEEKCLKTMNQEEAAFTYLREKFPKLSEATLKDAIFIGSQIRDLFKDEYFDRLFRGEEKAAWDSFKFVIKDFWETEVLKTMRSL
jgi:hypothetical protein